jgi:transposase
MEPKKRESFLKYTDDQLNAIYDAGKKVTVDFIKILIDKINHLEARVQELEEQISKDSHNSHKPPSSDNPNKKKRKPKSLRKKGGKVGGQDGHKGTNLKQSLNPDIVIPINTEGKCSCGLDLSAEKCVGQEKRQQFDIPEINITVTEYQADIVICSKCGKTHTAQFPEGINAPVFYGPNIKSLIVYLKHYGFISYERLAEFFEDVIGHSISQGTFVNTVNEYAKKIEHNVESIKEKLINGKSVHFDETGLRVEGSRYWLHNAGNNNFTYYFIHKNRGKIAMDEMGILPFFKGVAIHDHWDSYYLYSVCLHSLCNAHHLRELIFFEEQNEVWAKKIKKCLLNAKEKIDKDPVLSEKRILYYKRRLQRCINEGLKIHPHINKKNRTRGRPKQSKAHNLLKRLKKHIGDVIRFLSDEDVPFDNNLAERDNRMMKVQQKISGTFRSWRGAQNFCIIRSYLSTARKQGYSVYKAVVAGFKGFDILKLKWAE